jgi:hypothetical protein
MKEQVKFLYLTLVKVFQVIFIMKKLSETNKVQLYVNFKRK